ncbi:hypothetical protein RchiOBHm_Chr2g0138611 [Rosa chinensis]|uniref:Uncharacterized protein n=1 Tax=Rosa chinensis TaxID=74649 RepID=A0A2P6RWX4_ROSCH|nr:hypothetical protein RchiOBHm_Chr2g0138611 [Rosa chinensis]
MKGSYQVEVWSTAPMEAWNTYNTHEYKDDMKKFQKLALESQEQERVFVYRSRVSCVQE